MKNLALLLAISLLLSSCSLMNKDEVETIETPIIWEEVSIDIQEEDVKDEDKSIWDVDDITEKSLWEDSIVETMNDTTTDTQTKFENEVSNQIETEVKSELSSDIESEEALNEVFNEIEELFELAEQNGGQ